MQLNAVFVGMTHPQARKLVAIKACESDFLEAINHVLLLTFGRGVSCGETDHTSAVAPLVRACVDQIGHDLRIAAQDLGQRITGDFLGLPISIADQVAVFIIDKNGAGSQVIDRTSTATFAVWEKLDEHHDTSRCSSMARANCRSIATRAVVTRSASICDAWPARTAVFSHRVT
jgi:hypothetical protein